MTVTRKVCRRVLVSAAVLLALAAAHPTAILADPPVTASLNMTSPAARLAGELRFDLGGGPVSGNADLDVPADPRSLPVDRGGAGVSGRYRLRLEMQGSYRGGLFATMSGTVRLAGTFTNDAGCEAKVSGAGTFRGSVTGPSGAAEVTGDWERVEYQGCNLASPQPFAVNLPFGFPPVSADPVMNEQVPATGLQPPAGPAAWPLPARDMLIVAAGACCVGAALVGGLLLMAVAGRERKRQARLPSHLPEPAAPRSAAPGRRLPPNRPR